MVKKGRDLYFDGKLKLHISYDCDEVSAVINNANVASEGVERDCAVELVFAKAGMEAWDIAKHLKVREEVLMLQNPEITFPLQEDTNVVVYYKISN